MNKIFNDDMNKDVKVKGKLTQEMKDFLKEEKDKYKKSNINEQQLLLMKKLYIDDKVIFGLGIRKMYYYLKDNYPEFEISIPQVTRFLKSLEVKQLNNPVKETKDVGRTVMSAPFQRMEMDLLDLQNKEQKGYKYLLNIIDVFSKYALSIALKNKNDSTVLDGFKKLMKELKTKFNQYPKTIYSDNGSEFINSNMKKYLIRLRIRQLLTNSNSPGSHAKQVENFNGYIRRQLHNYEIQYNNPDWTQYYKKVINIYNNTRNRTTNTTPIDVMENKANNEDVRSNIDKATLNTSDEENKTKYKAGQKVRVKQYTPTFEKKTNNINWSREIYEIVRVIGSNTQNTRYKIRMIKDEDNNDVDEPIMETFYKNDLQPISKILIKTDTQPKYIVSKILKKRTRNGKKELLIKWKSYKDTTWEPYNMIQADVPKLVKKFEESI